METPGRVRRVKAVWAPLLVMFAGLSGVVIPAAVPAAASALGPMEASAGFDVPIVAAAAAERAKTPRTDVLWRGPDGEPLPFRNHAEVRDFLRTAEPLSMSDISAGSTLPKKVLLEKDGVRMHAIFRSFERVQERTADPDTGQTRFGSFKDSAEFEAAAYDMAMLLDLRLVPPTVRRVINNREGTLQLWVESAMTEKKRAEQGIEPPHATWWRGILQTLTIFDNLIFNADRNTGNLLIDPDWNVWFIDHTRAFQTRRDLRNPESIIFCERRLFERLRTLTDDEITEAMAVHLDRREIGALLQRRARVVEHIETLIEEDGEDAVLFDYSHDLSDWSRAPGN